jgi:hypothetical protein
MWMTEERRHDVETSKELRRLGWFVLWAYAERCEECRGYAECR